VLYFSILKHPGKSPLLAAALEGISHFAHLINIDFFRDLLAVLRKIIVEQDDRPDEEEEGEEEVVKVEVIGSGERARLRLLAIVTAFELLSGQGKVIKPFEEKRR
jgi:nucleolar complex protein 3